jgi:hypothetical protein
MKFTERKKHLLLGSVNSAASNIGSQLQNMSDQSQITEAKRVLRDLLDLSDEIEAIEVKPMEVDKK